MFLVILTFIIILGILILVHELGHFFTARIFGVKAEEFGLGYPPRIFGWVKDDNGRWKFIKNKDKAEDYKKTVWSLNWFPIGGFVKIKGEDENQLKEPDSFASRSIWQRFIMLFSGVFMNFVLCFVLLSIAFMIGIPTIVDDQVNPSLNASQEKIQIMSVSPDSPAARAGLEVGDIILSIDNQPVYFIQDVQDKIRQRKDEPTQFVISRGNQEITKQITPVSNSSDEPAMIGTGLVKTAKVKYSWYQAIYKGAEATLGLTIAILEAFAKIVGDLFTGQKANVEVAGPVGIAVLTGQVVKLGFIYILQFAALLSINLGVINLLPIPALDGGRILFLAIEKVKGRPVKQKVEAVIHQIGFILLMGIILLVTYKDIHTYGSKIWGAVAKIFNF
jgi:regulator of sigma E protease